MSYSFRHNNAANYSARPLGHVRVTGRALATTGDYGNHPYNVPKLPPVDVYPSRSFEDTFVRGLQVGKPWVINAGVQVSERDFKLADLVSSQPSTKSSVRSLGRLVEEEIAAGTRTPSRDELLEPKDLAQPEGSLKGGKREKAGRVDSGEIRRLREENAKLKEMINEIKEKRNADKEKMSKMLATIQELRSEITSREEDIQGLYDQVQEHEVKLEEEKQKTAFMHDLEERIRELEAIVEDQTKEIDSRDEQLQQVREKMITIEQDIAIRYEERIRELQKDLEAKIADKEMKIERMKRQTAEYLDQNSVERQKQMDDLTKDMAKIQDECDLLRAKVEAYKKKKKGNACENCSRLTHKLEEKTTKLQSATKDMEAMKSTQMKLKEQLFHQTEHKMEEMEVMKEMFQKALNEKQETLDRLKGQIRNLLENNSIERQSQVEDLTSRLSKIEVQNEALRLERKASQQELKNLQRENSEMQQHFIELNQQKMRLAEMLAEFKKMSEEEKAKLERKLKKLKDQFVEAMQTNSVERTSQLLDLSQQLNLAMSSRGDGPLSHRQTSLESEINTQRSIIEEQSTEIKSLTKKISKYKKQQVEVMNLLGNR